MSLLLVGTTLVDDDNETRLACERVRRERVGVMSKWGERLVAAKYLW
jgi:hypothetical protein